MKIKLLLTTSILALTPALLSAQEGATSSVGGVGNFVQNPGLHKPTTDFVTRKPAVNVEGPDMMTGSAFGVSVNGKTVSEGRLVNQERLNDIAMSRADISMRFDSKAVSRKLGSSVTFDESGKVHFMPYSNYPSFISRMELRFFNQSVSDRTLRPVFTMDVKDKTVVDLQRLEDSGALNGGFTLRAYDSRGNFDETELMIIAKQKGSLQNADLFAGYGINRLEAQGIPVRGGTVTVEGTKVRPESYVRVNKEYVPVDTSGKFISELIVPNGKSDVQIEYVGDDGNRKSYLRPIEIKQNDLFFFAMGDLTYGQNNFSGPAQIQAANPEEFEKEYVHGRAAFYLRGKVLGSFLITAMADTNEGDIEDIFSNFDEKDPRALLRRIDADRYYPVYGDSSTIEETAPTQGKVFVKIERDKSYAMWGNFETGIFNDDFTHVNRALYGAKLNYESNAMTSYGETKTQAVGFLADPGTFATRDEFRGTGGSIYFLNYQDITVGSERIRVEIRDRNSNITNYVKELAYGKDYDIDYIQGRILLNEPLNSTASDGDVVTSSGSEFGDPVVLVVDYETTPLGVTLDDNQIVGGTVQKWVGDNLLVGATASHENVNNGQNNTLYGANATLRYTPQTYIKGSYTESEGQSTEINRSVDGGYNNIDDPNRVGVTPNPVNPSTNLNASGAAYMVELAVDAKDFNEKVDGRLNAYYRDREAGFAGQGFAATEDTLQYGGAIQVGGSSGLTGKVEADIVETGNTQKTERYLGEVGYRGKKVFGTVGVGLEKDNTGAERTNVGVRAGYNINDRNNVYAFGQYTIDAQNAAENHRVGVGANLALTDKIIAGGEVAVNEEKDVTARVSVDYAHDDDSNYYLAYDINADRNNFGSGFNGITGSPTSVDGALVVGGRQRYGSSLSIFGEENFYHGTGNSGLTHTYGVDYTPWNDVTVGANVEIGEVSGLDRKAVSANVGYGNEKTHVSLAGEYRDEKSVSNTASPITSFENPVAIGRETQTYVVRANARHEINDEFSMIARGNASFSENNDAGVEDGEFAEASIGLAYRPKDNDRLNVLARYSYLYDLATAPQIASGTAISGQQRAHLASIDFSFDLNKYITLGGKYGYKSGEVNTGSGWSKVQNHLGIFRADIHVVHKWDLMLEGRMLWQEETETVRYGALAGVYYHLNDNVKIGGGYSWSEFDDDLSTLGYDNQGWFVNLITKF